MTAEMLLQLLTLLGPPLLTFLVGRYGDRLPLLAVLLKLFPAGPVTPQPVPAPVPQPVPAGPLPDWLSLILSLLMRARQGDATPEELHTVEVIRAVLPPPK